MISLMNDYIFKLVHIYPHEAIHKVHTHFCLEKNIWLTVVLEVI